MAAGPVLVTVPSESNPSKSYEIRLGNDGNVYCSCPAWKFQKIHPHLRTCKHMKALSKEIGEAAAKLKGGSKVAAPAKAAPVAVPVAAKVEAPKPVAVVAVETDPEAEVAALEKALAEKKAALAAKKAAAEKAAKKAAAEKKVAELKAALAAAEAELKAA